MTKKVFLLLTLLFFVFTHYAFATTPLTPPPTFHLDYRHFVVLFSGSITPASNSDCTFITSSRTINSVATNSGSCQFNQLAGAGFNNTETGYFLISGYVTDMYTISWDANNFPTISDVSPTPTPTPLPNQAPVLNPIGNKTATEGQLFEFTITASDPDGNTLTYSAANLPSGAAFNPQTRTFSWTPGFDQEGTYENVEFTVTDDGSPMELDVELITITVGNVNRAPVFAPVGSQEVLENELLTFTITATDPDGDRFSLAASNLPSGASFDPQTGVFSWTPTLSQEGVYTVTFNATDTGTPAATGSTDVVITVGDNPTPSEQADNLVDTVIAYDFPTNIENSYLANLKKVKKFIEDGKVEAAINQLEAFINKVEEDYTAGDITQVIRDDLVGLAQALIGDLQ